MIDRNTILGAVLTGAIHLTTGTRFDAPADPQETIEINLEPHVPGNACYSGEKDDDLNEYKGNSNFQSMNL